MQLLKAHIRNGQLSLDEPTDRPDGVVYVHLVERIVRVSDDDDGLNDEDRAELHEVIEASLIEADEGKTEDFTKFVAELRHRGEVRRVR